MKVCGVRSPPFHQCSSWVGSYVAKRKVEQSLAYCEVELDWGFDLELRWGFDSWALDSELFGAFASEQR